MNTARNPENTRLRILRAAFAEIYKHGFQGMRIDQVLAEKGGFIMSLEVNMSNRNKHKRPKYNLEFKQDAAKLVVEKGYTADSLGISLSAIGRWVRAEQGSTIASATKKPVLKLADQDELMRLRKENERLRLEREILKKAAVFPSTRSGQALRKKPNKIRIYSTATEDLSCDRAVRSDAGQHQRLLCVGSSA